VQIKNRQQVLAIVAITAVSLLAADKILITPLTHLWTSRAETIKDLRADIAKGQGLLDREQALRGRWERMRGNTLTNDAAAAEGEVIKSLDRWAQESRMSINSISPQPKKEEDNYSTLEFHVDATGRLDALSRFLYDMERDPMALRLDSVELTARDSEGQSLGLSLQLSGLLLAPQPSK